MFSGYPWSTARRALYHFGSARLQFLAAYLDQALPAPVARQAIKSQPANQRQWDRFDLYRERINALYPEPRIRRIGKIAE